MVTSVITEKCCVGTFGSPTMLWCRDGTDDGVVVVVTTDAVQELSVTSLAIGVAGVTCDRPRGTDRNNHNNLH